MSKGLGKDLLKYLPSKILPALVSFISLPIFTRIFSSDVYGQYTLVLNLVNIFTLILGWMSMSIIRFYPEYERRNKLGYFLTNNLVFLAFSVISTMIVYTIIMLLFKNSINAELYSLLWFGLPLLVVSATFSITQNILRAQRKVNMYSFSVVWKSAFTFLVGLLLVKYTQLGISALLISAILAMCIFSLLGYRNTFQGNISLTIFKKVDYQLGTSMLAYSLPLVIVNLAAWILSLSDRFMLELYRDSSEVGIYAATYQFSEQSIMMVATLFMMAGRPLLVRIWENQGEKQAKRFISNLTRYYLILSVPIVFGITALSKPLSALLFGDDFFEGYKVLPYIVIGAFFLGLQQRFQDGFILEKKTSFLYKVFLIAALVNIGINLVVIPMYGFIGAGISTVLSYILLLTLMIINSRKTLKWNFPFRTLFISSASSIIMITAIYFISLVIQNLLLYIIISVVVGALIYFSSLLLFNEINKEERMQITNFLKNK